MPRTPMTLARAALALLALWLPGCGAGLSGTYADETGLGSLEFKEDGTVYMTTFGGTIACTYKVDGEHVILKGPNGSQVLTRRGDRLHGGLGFSFVKR
jgi:hypothetical protein